MPSRKKRIFSSAPLAGRRSHRRGRPGYDEFRGTDLRTQRHYDSSAGQRLPPQHPFQGRLVRPQGRVVVRDRAAALRSANGPQHGRSPASRSGNDRRQTELRPGQTAGRDQRRQQKRSGPGRSSPLGRPRLAQRSPSLARLHTHRAGLYAHLLSAQRHYRPNAGPRGRLCGRRVSVHRSEHCLAGRFHTRSLLHTGTDLLRHAQPGQNPDVRYYATYRRQCRLSAERPFRLHRPGRPTTNRIAGCAGHVSQSRHAAPAGTVRPDRGRGRHGLRSAPDSTDGRRPDAERI